MDPQLKKGILELCILQQVSEKDVYGYDLVGKLKEFYKDVDISVYYTILRRLKNSEYVDSYEGKESGGPVRKYYRITEKGNLYLERKKEDWGRLHQITGQLGLG